MGGKLQAVLKLLKELKASKSITPAMYKGLKTAEPSLLNFVKDASSAERIYNMSDMKLVKKGVAKPTMNVNEYYRPAVRLNNDYILHHPEARIHAEALEKGLRQNGIDPYTFDYGRVHGSGGIGPDGYYYESHFMGDVPDAGEDLRKFLGGIDIGR